VISSALALAVACRQGTDAGSPPASDASRSDARANDGNTASGDAATDAGPRFTPPPRIVALGTWVPVRRDPRRDAALAGYLRAGTIVAVEGTRAGRETCPVHRDHPEGGWYRVAGGGYVCVGGALAIPWPARGFRRPVQPALDAGMPYQYASVNGTPNLYRAPPSMEELRVYEPWRFPDADTSVSAATESADPSPPSDPAAPTSPEQSPSITAAATPPAPAPAALTGPAPVAPTTPERAPNAATPTAASAPAVAAAPTPAAAETPSGEPTLRDLRGDRSGPVIRRLIRGMHLSLDRTVVSQANGDRYWRTQSGGFVRTGPLSMDEHIPTFRGVELDAAHTLPFAFAVSPRGTTYRLAANGLSASAHRPMPRLTPIQLTADPPVVIGANTYYRTVDGVAVNGRHVRVALFRAPPADLSPGEKWIDIDLDAQILVAYEGPRPVFVTLVSSGRRATNELERFETPAGRFRIRGKHVTTTMDGDTAADGPYSIEDVPWAMYFFESYALHGAFWHGNYGWRMSHGCVNLSPSDAQHLFSWVEPALPEGWHGVFATDEHPGTRVLLHHGDRPAPLRPTFDPIPVR